MILRLTEFAPIVILVGAALLDYIIGDPWSWPHPVQVMGGVISRYSDFVLPRFEGKWPRRLAGIILGVGLMGGSAIASWGMVQLAAIIHPLVGIVASAIALGSCFAARSLRDAAFDVLQPLQNGDLDTARTKLSLYVGRDTNNLSQAEILRAVLETIAENTTDGVTAPLFYAILGSCIPGVGAIPLCFAYKAASTLDSMVGYRREPYQDLGWFSAQFEDRLTWLPCRLTVLTIALLSGKPGYVLTLCRRDAIQDSSPNSGWSECAYGAALGVQMGGKNSYNGVIKEKPLLGEAKQPITPEIILQALKFTRICILLWLVISCLLLVIGY
ncbi:MAG: adenosylcobinamide-phosphate synthase CbiB [Jaaginema sp. PMC 1079.18]|nr:adenosylcobinamide-phosphate synthase CbiB [Jaaginema sp. PMC 1080.18]MEC4851445.1 adenosylcobinamide-phosphate synthase CbiB [Jaaginema sp. PMC 1079.18]MEC4868252.1 adenosylcobinamide-phosphate synthase CbiB [Jaaginema sp. PMC 1078.18]